MVVRTQNNENNKCFLKFQAGESSMKGTFEKYRTEMEKTEELTYTR